ncbi:MAG: AAA family ATPase [Lachnospiraceae bacterium]
MITDEIVDWVKTLSKWQQMLAERILNQRSIDDEFLVKVYNIFKIESGLSEGEAPEKIEFTKCSSNEKKCKIHWCSVGNISGVNRLASKDHLNVGEKLTIVYGENGSGKSGYTRLLNNAFISRGDKEIISDIYSKSIDDIYAEFSFDIDGCNRILKYPEDKNHFAFSRIRNFDSKSAMDDMMKESAVDFAPSELTFFDTFISACLEIQKMLDKERERKEEDNPFIKFFQNKGKALDAISSLTEKSNVEEIKKTFTISDEEKEQIKEVKIEKAKLVSLNINTQSEQINKVLQILELSIEKAQKFNGYFEREKIEEYKQEISALLDCKKILSLEGVEQFDAYEIESIGSPEWKTFIEAAKKYFDNIEKHYKCPLCGQSISKDDLIYKYWTYLESSAEKNYKTKKAIVDKLQGEIQNLDLLFVNESSIQEDWLVNNFKQNAEEIKNMFEQANKYRKKFQEEITNMEVELESYLIDTKIIEILKEKVSEKKNSLNQEEITKQISTYTKMENDYLDKEKVLELIPLISTYIEKLKWIAEANKGKIKTRSITNKQNELFKKYITEDYLSMFALECSNLNADFDAEIISRGSNGVALKKLQIKGNAPGKILSEGEQRAVAIANFLTEIQMDVGNVAIVLDDPVCSLDHKRRTVIAKRLLEESKRRQVIIFTHEISFFMELKTLANKESISFLQENVRKIGNVPGNIVQTIPWQGMNVKDRTGKLKNDLQEMTNVFNSGDMDGYYYKAKNWCELLRESWERAVEEILFNDSIQRYNPCVQTKRLKKAPFSPELYEELENGMTLCSAWCHDQASAINGTVPSLEELKGFIECFETYCKKNRA